MSLEALGGYFIAIPLDVVSNWEGDCDGSERYLSVSKCGDWIAVSPDISIEHLVLAETSPPLKCDA